MRAPLPVRGSLSGAAPRPYWTDRDDAPEQTDPIAGRAEADLVIVGGGFTGLWAALEAISRDPARSVLVLEAQRVGFGASGRNGGFLSSSLTHGVAHGAAIWPGQLDELRRQGEQNLSEIAQYASTLAAEGFDPALALCGKSVMAVTPHQLAGIADAAAQQVAYGEDVSVLDADAAQRDIASPTYLGGMRVRTGSGLVDPARLCWGLRSRMLAAGVALHEGSPVTALSRDGNGVQVSSPTGTVRAGQVLLATNAFPPLLRRIRSWVLPVYDHVLVTEPLTREQLDAVGWPEAQGVTDAGNQFHYYRRTPDDRILWGGYDAVYYFGNRTDAAREQRQVSHERLARHFFTTFPQLEGLQFTHRWAGLIDTTSRFTPVFGTAMAGRVAYSTGYTGLGVAASRFGARVALDLLAGERTERTALDLVRRKPVPFPPEPLRYPLVQATRAALAREDARGRRGAWLRLLDAFGVGFNS